MGIDAICATWLMYLKDVSHFISPKYYAAFPEMYVLYF
jgi:hypothetical protein